MAHFAELNDNNEVINLIVIDNFEILDEDGKESETIGIALAKQITNTIKIPTIGIGASRHCDGQILVLDDIIGLSNFRPKFVKKYANIRKTINSAVHKFKREVRFKKYPSKKFSY